MKNLLLLMLILGMSPAFAQAQEDGGDLAARINALRSEVNGIREDVRELKTGYTEVIASQETTIAELREIRGEVAVQRQNQQEMLGMLDEGNKQLQVVRGQMAQAQQEAAVARGQAGQAWQQAQYARQQAAQAQAYAAQAREATGFTPLRTAAAGIRAIFGGG